MKKSILSFSLFLTTIFSSGAFAITNIDISQWAGDFQANTLTEWMKHDNNWENGRNAIATLTFESQVQIPESTEIFQKLTVNVISGRAADERTNFEIFKGTNGVFYEEVASLEQQKEILVPYQQSGNKLISKTTDHAAGSEFKGESIYEFVNNNKLVITKKFSCCKFDLGHAGCLVHGMCSDIYTLTR